MERRTAALLAGILLLSCSVGSGTPQSGQPLVARGSNVYGAGVGFDEQINIGIEEPRPPPGPISRGPELPPSAPRGPQQPALPVRIPSPLAPSRQQPAPPLPQQPRPQPPLPVQAQQGPPPSPPQVQPFFPSQGRGPAPSVPAQPVTGPRQPVGLDQIDLRVSELISDGNKEPRPVVPANQLGPQPIGQGQPPQSQVVGIGPSPASIPRLPDIDNALTGLPPLSGRGSLVGPGATGRDNEIVLGFERNSAQAGGEAEAVPPPAFRSGVRSGPVSLPPPQRSSNVQRPSSQSPSISGLLALSQQGQNQPIAPQQPFTQQGPGLSGIQGPPPPRGPGPQDVRQSPEVSVTVEEIPQQRPGSGRNTGPAEQGVVRGGSTYGLGSDNTVPAPPSVPSGDLNIELEEPDTKIRVLSQAALPDSEPQNVPGPVAGPPRGPPESSRVLSQAPAPLSNRPLPSPPRPAVVPRPPAPAVNGDGHHMGGIEWLPESIPGEPLVDYPVLSQIPESGFDCGSLEYDGFFADTSSQARCQVFWVCHNDQQDGFLCPNGTIFHQRYFTCDWWFNVDCDSSSDFYDLNRNIGVVGTRIDTQPAGVVAAASKVHPVFTLLSEMLHFPRVPPVRPQNRTRPSSPPQAVPTAPAPVEAQEINVHIFGGLPSQNSMSDPGQMSPQSGKHKRFSDSFKRNSRFLAKYVPEAHRDGAKRRHRKHTRRRERGGRPIRHLQQQHQVRASKHRRRSPADAAAAAPVAPAPLVSDVAAPVPGQTETVASDTVEVRVAAAPASSAPAPVVVTPAAPAPVAVSATQPAPVPAPVQAPSQPAAAAPEVINVQTAVELPKGVNGQAEAPIVDQNVQVMNGNSQAYSSQEKVVAPAPGAPAIASPLQQIAWGQQNQFPGGSIQTSVEPSQPQSAAAPPASVVQPPEQPGMPAGTQITPTGPPQTGCGPSTTPAAGQPDAPPSAPGQMPPPGLPGAATQSPLPGQQPPQPPPAVPAPVPETPPVPPPAPPAAPVHRPESPTFGEAAGAPPASERPLLAATTRQPEIAKLPVENGDTPPRGPFLNIKASTAPLSVHVAEQVAPTATPGALKPDSVAQGAVSQEDVDVKVEVDEPNANPVKEEMHYPPQRGDGVQNPSSSAGQSAGTGSAPPAAAKPDQPIIDTTLEMENAGKKPFEESLHYPSAGSGLKAATTGKPLGSTSGSEVKDPSGIRHDMPSEKEDATETAKSASKASKQPFNNPKPGEIQITSESMSKIIKRPKQTKKIRDPAGIPITNPRTSISEKINKKFSSRLDDKNQHERSLSATESSNKGDMETIIEKITVDESEPKEPEKVQISEKIETVEEPTSESPESLEDNKSDNSENVKIIVATNAASKNDKGKVGDKKKTDAHEADSGWKSLPGPMGMNVRVYVKQVPMDSLKDGDTNTSSLHGDETAKSRREIEPKSANVNSEDAAYDYDVGSLPDWMQRAVKRRVNREEHPVVHQHVVPDQAPVPGASMHQVNPVVRSGPKIRHKSIHRPIARKRDAPSVLQSARKNLMAVLGGPTATIDSDIDRVVEDAPSDKDKRENELKIRFDPDRLTSYSNADASWF